MSTNTKRELLSRIRREYLAADRQRKSKLLNSLIEATGYNRKYAITLLSKQSTTQRGPRKTRTSKYGNEVVEAVLQLWRAANGICAKRLLPFFPTLIETLERWGHMNLPQQLKEKILGMSLSTLERILKKERDKELKGKSLTRPGSLLKKQVAVKTFAEWSDQKTGFFEVDLVAHCGGDISGKFLQTLTMTDIATGWTEILPLLHGSSAQVRSGMEKVVELLPFKLKGIDCDNGKEFLNHEMVAWCKARKITFTRSRAYRKNDQAHVEEKNGSVVRKLVGYERFEGVQSQQVMSDLYAVSRLYINYFQPSMKLVKKTRMGAKVTKQYDTAKTPLQRLLECKTTSKQVKADLLREFRQLDPLVLLGEMATLQAKLWQLTRKAATEAALESAIARPLYHKQKPACSARTETVVNTSKRTPQYCVPERAASRRSTRSDVRDGQRQARYDRVELTDDFVETACWSASQQQIIHRDSTLIGFGLRVTRGSKSFVVERRINGKNSRITVGRADLFSVQEARNEALQLLRRMAAGIHPLTLKNKPRR